MQFRGRAGLLQRVFVPYRAQVFDLIAQGCAGGLSIAAGDPAPSEAIVRADPKILRTAEYFELRNRHFFSEHMYLCWQSGLTDWLSIADPDVVVVEANPRYISIPVVLRWMHARDRPVLGHGLGVMPLSSGFERVRQIGRKWLYCSFDAIVAYSSRAAEGYVALGVPPDNVFIASNAVSPRPTWVCPVREEKLDRKPRVLFTGRLTASKRVDILIEACSTIRAVCPVDLWIVGEGPERSALEMSASRILPEARFFGEKRGHQLAELFAAADIFVLPGLGGLAVQEAMAYGMPVIVADGDGTQSDLVRPGNGWNISGGDSRVLAQCLINALSNIPRLRAMGRESYRIIADEINAETMAESFLTAFAYALDKRRGTRTNS